MKKFTQHQYNLAKTRSYTQAVKMKNVYKVTPVIEEQADASEDIIQWGHDNSYPRQLIKFVKGSTTAQANLRVYKKFVQGSGLSEYGDKKANKHQTFNQVMAEIATNITWFRAFAVHVQYNMQGQFKSVKCIPAERFRFKLPEDEGDELVTMIRINPYYGTGLEQENKKFTEDFPAFDAERFAEHIKQFKKDFNGQVYIARLLSPGEYHYPQKFDESDFDLFDTERKITQFHSRNLDNNFMLSVMLKVIGNPYEQVLTNPHEEDESRHVYKYAKDLLNEAMEKDFSGSENAGKVLVQWAQRSEDFPQIDAFPSNVQADLFNATKDNVKENISTVTGVPTMLSNIQSSASIQNTDGILNAVQLLNMHVKEEQEEIQRFFNVIFQNFENLPPVEVDIKPLNPLEVLPTWAWEALTVQEQRNFVEKFFPIELELQQTDDSQAEEAASRFGEFGVGGVQGILQIQQSVAAGVTSVPAALELLKVIYGFDEEVALRMLGEVKEQNEQAGDTTIQE